MLHERGKRQFLGADEFAHFGACVVMLLSMFACRASRHCYNCSQAGNHKTPESCARGCVFLLQCDRVCASVRMFFVLRQGQVARMLHASDAAACHDNVVLPCAGTFFFSWEDIVRCPLRLRCRPPRPPKRLPPPRCKNRARVSISMQSPCMRCGVLVHSREHVQTCNAFE